MQALPTKSEREAPISKLAKASPESTEETLASRRRQRSRHADWREDLLRSNHRARSEGSPEAPHRGGRRQGGPAAVTASERFRDVGVPQFWDGQKKLGKEVARSIGAPDWTAWDIYLIYGPSTEWTDQGFPAPEAALAQVKGVVVGTNGTLTPAGDQARVPSSMRGRVDLVGEQADLETLLSKVAEPFATRYPSTTTR